MQDLQSTTHSLSQTGAAVERKNVFISYSHNDKKFLERFHVHLKPLKRDGLLDIWDDTQIQPGGRWRDEIARALASARVAVLLVSADFLASDFIAQEELPPLLRASEDKGAKIIPVILKPCRFQRVFSLSCFQAVNPWLKPVDQMEEWEQEELWTKLVITIENLMGRPPPPGREDVRPQGPNPVIPWLKRLQVILSQWVTAYVALPYSWLASSVVVVALVVFAYHAGYANAREPAVLVQKAPDVIDSEYVRGLPEGDYFKPKITVPEGVPGKEKSLREEFLVKLVNLEASHTYPAVAVITSEPFLDNYKSFNASVRFKLPSTDKLSALCAPFLVRNSREALKIQLLYPEISGPKEDQSLGFHVPESQKADFIIVLIWMSDESYKYNHEDPKMLKIVVNQ